MKAAYKTSGLQLSNGVIGAASELIVACDLLKKGYEVFRAVSPSCSCDLIIHKNGDLKRIEVRTGYYYKDKLHCASRKKIRADILAISVRATEEVIYEPAL